LTVQEIYDAVVFNLWGNTGAPAGVEAVINRIIEQCHRRVQQDYNYWFMHTWAALECEAGVQSYALPENFKEYISSLWQTVDSEDEPNGFTKILSVIGMGDAQQYLWQQDGYSVEYPEYVEITGGNLVVYPDITEARTLYLVYWMFLDLPDAAEDDDLTIYGDEVLVNMATYKTALHLKEFDLVNAYKTEYLESLELLKNEDRRRRQSPINWVDYND